MLSYMTLKDKCVKTTASQCTSFPQQYQNYYIHRSDFEKICNIKMKPQSSIRSHKRWLIRGERNISRRKNELLKQSFYEFGRNILKFI